MQETEFALFVPPLWRQLGKMGNFVLIDWTLARTGQRLCMKKAIAETRGTKTTSWASKDWGLRHRGGPQLSTTKRILIHVNSGKPPSYLAYHPQEREPCAEIPTKVVGWAVWSLYTSGWNGWHYMDFKPGKNISLLALKSRLRQEVSRRGWDTHLVCGGYSDWDSLLCSLPPNFNSQEISCCLCRRSCNY